MRTIAEWKDRGWPIRDRNAGWWLAEKIDLDSAKAARDDLRALLDKMIQWASGCKAQSGDYISDAASDYKDMRREFVYARDFLCGTYPHPRIHVFSSGHEGEIQLPARAGVSLCGDTSEWLTRVLAAYLANIKYPRKESAPRGIVNELVDAESDEASGDRIFLIGEANVADLVSLNLYRSCEYNRTPWPDTAWLVPGIIHSLPDLYLALEDAISARESLRDWFSRLEEVAIPVPDLREWPMASSVRSILPVVKKIADLLPVEEKGVRRTSVRFLWDFSENCRNIEMQGLRPEETWASHIARHIEAAICWDAGYVPW